MIKIDGYVGICGVCFEPIKQGTEIQFMEDGKFFHLSCSESNPDSYYLALEKIRSEFKKGINATQLMNDMERIFLIPALNNEKFNEDNPQVINLYREISDSRFNTKDCTDESEQC